MLKYVVICGADLVDHDAKILSLLNASEKSIPNYDRRWNQILPEAIMGAQAVRNLVRSHIENDCPSVFITRYEHTVSEFICHVIDGKIARNELVIKLVRYDIDGIIITEHQIDDQDHISNNWPIGILW